jgi:pyruvate dehydrogenase E1 component
MRSVPAQVAPYLNGKSFTVLGTDGMGRSDTREALRRHFEIDMPHIVVAVLHQFALAGDIPASVVADAIRKYGIDPESPVSLLI